MPFTEITLNITTIVLAINFILAFVLVFMERRNPSATWAWLLVLFFIPGLGFVLYLFLGQDLRKKKLFSIKTEDDMERLAQKQESLLENEKLNIKNPAIVKDQDLIHLCLHNARAVFTQDNEVKILQNGAEKFPALIKSLKQAKDHIHMEYYIIRDDRISRTVRDILVQKAREGIEVRLLYDGMGCIALPKSYFRPLIEAGVHVAAFYPPFVPYINVRVNYRNHRKIIVIDGKTAFIGGLNLGDEYLGLSPKYGFWRDIHLKIQGTAVASLQLRFMADWQFAYKNKLPFTAKYFPEKPGNGNVGIQIVSSGPDSKWASIRQAYFKMITKAQKSIYIQTPYFVPDDSLTEALKTAALGGVDVRIMIPCKPDHPFVYWASTSYIGELLETGVRAYTYMNGFLHSKLLLVDGQVGSVGTANLDIRSFKVNFEVNALLYDPEIITELEYSFIEDMKKSKEITLEDYHKRSLPMRFKESVSRLLSPLL